MSRRVAYVPLDDLAPAERNAKLHAGATIADSIERFGFVDLPVVDERTGRLIAGHGRREDLLARRARGEAPPDGVTVRKGVWHVPVVRGWSSDSDAEAEALGIALNRTVELGGWDQGTLAAMLTELAGTEVGFAGVGFEQRELDELLAELGRAEPPTTRGAPDDVPELPERAITKPGDLWLLGEHRLLCGSAAVAGDVERIMAGELGHLIATDPPYGIDYSEIVEGRENQKAGGYEPIESDDLRGAELGELLHSAFALAVGVLADDAAWLVWHAPGENRELTRHALNVAAGVLIHKEIVWVKPHFVFGRWEYHWRHEPAMYGWRSGHHPEFRGARDQSTVWEVDHDGGIKVRNGPAMKSLGLGLHPTQKPVELWTIPINNHTLPRQVVFDPFAGSGPALTAAHTTGRRARLVEKDPRFCDVICGRWQALTGDRPVLERTGKPRSFVRR